MIAQPSFDKGVFTISLDLELVWGMLDLVGPERYAAMFRYERDHVIERLLDLFVEFEISATWCVLGHLFLEKCSPQGGRSHPEVVRPSHAWHPRDWFVDDPGTDLEQAPIFYGRDLISKIKACSVPQEIGSHSFSHIIFGDEGCSRDAAASDLRECKRLADEAGVEMTSFVFPRNEIGHLDVVREAGFKCYRGVEPNWFESRSVSEPLRRALRLRDVLLASKPPVVMPVKEDNGLWNIPGSAMYFPMHGLRRYIPIDLRVKRAIKGLDAAARERKVFHLWFHPTNLADQADTMFAGLRRILTHASDLREDGRLEVLTMRDVAAKSDQ